MKEKLTTKKCKHHGITDFILEGRGAYRCKKCRCEGVIKRRKKLKAKLVNFFGGKCAICSYSKCVEALEFHHLDPLKKSFAISYAGVTRAYNKALNEAMKCILVCANCHREIENKLTNYPTQTAQKSL